MTKITFMAFDGEIPRMDQHYLPESNALEARNVKLTSGTLRPLREPLPVHTLEGGGRSQIYYYAGEWLSWFQDADAVPGPIAAARLYVTREVDQPQLYFGGNFVNLELPSPTARPTVARTGTLDPALAETVLYAYTHVTVLGEETRPSPLSFQIERSPGTTITISGIPTITELRGRNILQNRLYRSVTTSSGLTELFLVRVLSPGVGSVTDPFGTYSPQEAIASTDYDPVPTNLRGLTAMPNGMMAGFVGRQIFFCEPYQPHAWPRKYSLTVNDNIIGLVTLGSTLMVLTKDRKSVV